MKYMSVATAATKWGLKQRSVQLHCERGNIPGTTIEGKSWQIPADADPPCASRGRTDSLQAYVRHCSPKSAGAWREASTTVSRSTSPTARTTLRAAA